MSGARSSGDERRGDEVEASELASVAPAAAVGAAVVCGGWKSDDSDLWRAAAPDSGRDELVLVLGWSYSSSGNSGGRFRAHAANAARVSSACAPCFGATWARRAARGARIKLRTWHGDDFPF